MNSKPSNSDFHATTREAIISFIIWMIALVWSVGACWYFGYPSARNSVSNISASTSWGIPNWVILGVLVPWLSCYLASTVFALWIMRDQDLGDTDG